MYKETGKDPLTNKVYGIFRITDSTFIPFDPLNTDYVNFKKDAANGVEVQDADGNKLSANDVKVLLRDLP